MIKHAEAVLETFAGIRESMAGRSHARSSVFGKDMRVIPDRMDDSRTKRRKSEREQDTGSKAKQPFVAAEGKVLIHLDDILEARKTSGFGFDMAVRMGVHGVGTSPSASGDPHGRGRFTFHVPVGGAAVVLGDPLATGKRGKKKRRRTK